MEIFSLEIDGTPIPYKSVQSGNGIFYNPRAKAKEEVRAQLKKEFQYKIITVPIRMDIEFVFTPPVSWKGTKIQDALTGSVRHGAKPDRDNLLKFIGDAMNGIVYTDDKLVDTGWVIKSYGPRAMTRIEIYVA